LALLLTRKMAWQKFLWLAKIHVMISAYFSDCSQDFTQQQRRARRQCAGPKALWQASHYLTEDDAQRFSIGPLARKPFRTGPDIFAPRHGRLPGSLSGPARKLPAWPEEPSSQSWAYAVAVTMQLLININMLASALALLLAVWYGLQLLDRLA
jgi:hypothetical protein